MLKVAPCMVVQSNSRKSKFFWLDGLLLLLPFCIIMGLPSASSAIIIIFFHMYFKPLQCFKRVSEHCVVIG